MKATVKPALLFIALLTVFSSCRSYELTHYKRSEIDKVGANISDYTVYIHDKTNTYQVLSPSLATTGVKGGLTQIYDSATIAEINNPRTKKLLLKHKHDLNIYTKNTVTDNSDVILKKEDISDITIITKKKSKSKVGLYAQMVGVAVYGTVVWVLVVEAFEGKL